MQGNQRVRKITDDQLKEFVNKEQTTKKVFPPGKATLCSSSRNGANGKRMIYTLGRDYVH